MHMTPANAKMHSGTKFKISENLNSSLLHLDVFLNMLCALCNFIEDKDKYYLNVSLLIKKQILLLDLKTTDM